MVHIRLPVPCAQERVLPVCPVLTVLLDGCVPQADKVLRVRVREPPRIGSRKISKDLFFRKGLTGRIADAVGVLHRPVRQIGIFLLHIPSPQHIRHGPPALVILLILGRP